MKWYNNFFATPIIGIKFQKRAKDIPLIEKIVCEHCEDGEWALSTAQGHKWVADNRDLAIHFEPGHVFVNRKYACKIEGKIGEMPKLIVPEPQSYETLVGEITSRIQDLWQTLCKYQEKLPGVMLIGLILKVDMPLDAIPPGIASLIEYLNKPWPNGLEAFNGSFMTNILEENEHVYRCHHNFQMQNSEAGHFLKMSLDYQKSFTSPVELDSSRLQTHLSKLIISGQEYFNKLGKEGIGDGI